jgi:hypothetical protein
MPNYNSLVFARDASGLVGDSAHRRKNGLFADNPACIPSLFRGLIVTKLRYRCWNQLLTRYLSVSFVPLDAFVIHESVTLYF